VSGDPGVGKTRLADELALSARAAGARVLWGRCWEAGGAPAYWPWIQILRAWAREAPPEPAAARRLGPGAAHLVRMVPELAAVLDAGTDAVVRSASDPDPDVERFHLFDATATLLEQAARAEPLVLVLDDLHAADRPSLLLLQFVARELHDGRLLAIGLVRDADARRDPERAAILADLSGTARRLPLAGLDPAEVGRLAEEILGVAPGRALVGALHRATDGNPFFVDELLRLWVAEGGVPRDEDLAIGRFGIPAGVRDVIRRRLAPLPPADVAVLEVAAIEGRHFQLASLERLAGRDLGALLATLGRAGDAGIVVPVGAAPGRWAFSHALIREVLYDDLDPARRIALHRTMGEALEERYRADTAPHLAELAHHFLAAAPGGGAERALAWAVRAAERAVAGLAWEEATAHYEGALAALALGPPDERRQAELLLALGDAQGRAGDLERARTTFLRAIEIARRLGEPEMLALGALGVGGHWAQKFTATIIDCSSAALLEEARDALPAGDSALRARVVSRLALSLYFANQRARGRALAREAVEMARRLGDLGTLTGTLCVEHAVLLGPDHLPERLELAAEILRLGEASGDPELALRAHALRLVDFHEAGDGPAYAHALEAYARLAAEARDPFEKWLSTMCRATHALMAGRFAEADRWREEAIELARRYPGQQSAFENVGMCSLAQLFQRRREEGRLAEVEQVMRVYAEDFPHVPAFRCLLALISIDEGRPEAARRILDELAVGGFAPVPRDVVWGGAIAGLCEVAARTGARAHAAVLYDLLLPFASRGAGLSTALSLGSTARYLGLVAAALGRTEAAVRHLEDAIDGNRALGARPWLARSQHDLAVVLAGRGEVERARALAAEAEATAEALGMRRLVEEAAALRDRLEATADPPAGCADDSATVGHLRHDGEFWTISFERREVRVKDLKGVAYLAHLLREPEREFHALELVRAVHGVAGEGLPADAVPRELRESGLRVFREEEGFEFLDEPARAAYVDRLRALRAELDEARAWRDLGRAERLTAEGELLEREIVRAVGLGGRTRKAGASAERARLSVTRAVKRVLERIERAHPALAHHFARTVRTGAFCSYNPDPRAPLVWRVQAGPAAESPV
jgi:tetratricopeptide (TPR) repeat protein